MLFIKGIQITDKHIQKFYDKINTLESGCWEINMAKDKDGYNRFSITQNYQKAALGAHRFMYQIHHPEEDINGLEICHTCDHPWCVNPDHLFADTHQVNVADCVSKNRQSKGSMLPQSVLTEDIVHSILQDILNLKYDNIKQIANKFNVIPGTILHLVHERSWFHITSQYDMNHIRNIIIDPTTKSGKLTREDVLDIRHRLSLGETKASIARVYKIDNSVVRKIFRNEIHKNIF